MNKFKQLMNYLDTYPNDYIHFHSIYMVLMLDTNAAYLVMPKAQSRISGYYYLGNKPNSKPHPELNRAILIEFKHLRMLFRQLLKQKQG